MPGRHPRQAELLGKPHKGRQAPGVAGHAGVRRLAREVPGDERLHYVGRELELAVDDMMRQPEMACRARRHLQGARRAAAAPILAGPKPDGRGLEGASLIHEQQRRDGAVDPAA